MQKAPPQPPAPSSPSKRRSAIIPPEVADNTTSGFECFACGALLRSMKIAIEHQYTAHPTPDELEAREAAS